MLGVEVEHRAELLRRAHRRPEDIELFERYANGHRLWRRTGRRSYDDDPAARFGERDERAEVLAADVVGREVDTPRHALELLAPVLRVVVDTPLRTEFFRLFDLLVAPRGDEHTGS